MLRYLTDELWALLKDCNPRILLAWQGWLAGQGAKVPTRPAVGSENSIPGDCGRAGWLLGWLAAAGIRISRHRDWLAGLAGQTGWLAWPAGWSGIDDSCLLEWW